MKNAELIALMIANTNKTRNMRTYGKKWYSGARRICDKVATKIGKMVALIQDKIDHGHIINGKNQSLLVYNFQPLFVDNTSSLISLDMVIKPIEQINNTHDLFGEPIQIVVDIVSGEVMNNAQALVNMGLTDDDFYEDTQNPITYGNYSEYHAICSYIALRYNGTESINADDIFSGRLDKSPMIQTSLAFDSFVEARDYLDNNRANYRMVAELNYPKEKHPYFLTKGVIGAHIIKLIHPHHPSVEVSTQMPTSPKEQCIDDEVHRLLDAATEHDPIPDFGIANA